MLFFIYNYKKNILSKKKQVDKNITKLDSNYNKNKK